MLTSIRACDKPQSLFPTASLLLGLRCGSFVALLLVYLLFPTGVDCISDDLPIAGVDAANKKYLDIVLDGDKLRVVDSRLPRNLLALLCHFDPYRCKSQRWLAVQFLGLLASFIDNAVLFGLYAVLFASFTAVCKNRPGRRVTELSGTCSLVLPDVVQLTRTCSGLGHWRPR